MNPWLGIVISFAFVFAVIGVAQTFLKLGWFSASVTRKVVHIGVAHWWLVAMAVLPSLGYALIGPLAFIAINAISYKTHVFKAMEHEVATKNLGTIYFPIALTLLVLLTWGLGLPKWYGAVAILVLGWGDGMASLVGEHFPGMRFRLPGGRKSLNGTAAMFAAAWATTGIVAVVFGMEPATAAALGFIVAGFATATELATPFGLDNISMPLVSILVLALLIELPAPWISRFAWAVGLNLALALGAFFKRAVTPTGALAGAAIGVGIYLSGGFYFWSVLGAFFVSSSVLSRIGKQQKAKLETKPVKGDRRDHIQVTANGGVAMTMAVAYAVTGWPVFMVAFAIALAASTADTWASEIGVLSKRRPVNVLTWKQLEPGTSGGVSVLGLFASLFGSAFIAGWFVIGYWITVGWDLIEIAGLFAAITGGGFLGSVVDSVLGASIQAHYWDSITGAITEHRFTDGIRNSLARGIHGITNDVVNALSGLVAAVAMIALLA